MPGFAGGLVDASTAGGPAGFSADYRIELEDGKEYQGVIEHIHAANRWEELQLPSMKTLWLVK